MKKYVSIVVAASQLSGCGSFDRLKNVGKAPAMSPTDDITAPAYEPSIASKDPARLRGNLPTTPGHREKHVSPAMLPSS